jgi:hypothetical protein
MSLQQVAHRRRMLRFLSVSRDAHVAPQETARRAAPLELAAHRTV